MQVSQEAGQVVSYSHLFKNFPQFVMIHTVKDFSKVYEAEADVFLECFFNNPTDVGNLLSDSSAFSKSCLNIWKFSVYYCWSYLRILSINFLVREMSEIVW